MLGTLQINQDPNFNIRSNIFRSQTVFVFSFYFLVQTRFVYFLPKNKTKISRHETNSFTPIPASRFLKTKFKHSQRTILNQSFSYSIKTDKKEWGGQMHTQFNWGFRFGSCIIFRRGTVGDEAILEMGFQGM